MTIVLAPGFFELRLTFSFRATNYAANYFNFVPQEDFYFLIKFFKLAFLSTWDEGFRKFFLPELVSKVTASFIISSSLFVPWAILVLFMVHQSTKTTHF